jgi:Cyclin, N-terminal domain/Cyclin, C-terminal domain
MGRQTELKPIMRSILVDWLVEVHKKFVLLPETLHLTVALIDRYLSVARVPRLRFQLLGITALFIASKYEEIYPPEVKDCVYTTDRGVSRQDVLDMEMDILQALNFRISGPTAYPFLVRFLFITEATQTARFAANYYLERFLQEYDYINHRPSLIAAAAVCLALHHPEIREYDQLDGVSPGVVGIESVWIWCSADGNLLLTCASFSQPDVLLKYTGFSFHDIANVAHLIADKIVVNITTSSRALRAVYDKYDTAAFEFISSEFSPPPRLDSVASLD